MPDLVYGPSTVLRDRGDLPKLTLRNMYLEKAPTEKGGVTLQSAKGLSLLTSHGNGPVRATKLRSGMAGGQRVTVSGNAVFVGSTNVGSVSGDGPVSIAWDDNEVLIAAGGPLYRWDGSALTTPTLPFSEGVTFVRHIAGYFIIGRAGTGRWYFSGVNDGSSWDALDFANAENEPDALLDVLPLNDGLALLGDNTSEFWTRSGLADLPFVAIQQRVYERGVFATGCAVAEDNGYFFVGDDGIFYRGGGGVPEALSDEGVTEDIQASETVSVFVFTEDRHKFIAVRLDTKTLCYDVTTGTWHERASSGRDNWSAQCADGGILGDDSTGNLWQLSGYVDASGPFERSWSAWLPIQGTPARLFDITARAQVGATTYLSGDYSDPIIEMRLSHDGGRTFDSWMGEALGEAGDYRNVPEWRALGMADYPGVLVEWRVTDPVPVRFSGATFNEKVRGRSRG